MGLARAGQCIGITAALLIIGNDSLQTAIAEGDTRTLSFHHVHTGEDLTVTFKRNGRYDDDALKKLNWLLRDWRREEDTKMDPHLFDLLWEAYREVDGKEPIQVISGYRSPQTNSMLRARSSGVAQFSLHTQGDAMDFYIPGVPLEAVRTVGLRLQRGGVGFYPTSGSPFVHLDTGSIRHWPRMTHDQLVKVFPNERTVHIPADGQPLAGYALALADVERQGHAPSAVSLAAARNAGVIDENEERAAAPPKRSLLADLFGFGTNANEKSEKPPAPSRAPVAVASLSPPIKVVTEPIVPLPKGRPTVVAALTPIPPPRPVVATAALANVITARGYWPAAIEMGPALPPPVAANKPSFELAAADPITTASTEPALSYAAEPGRPAANRASPMGVALPKMRPAPIAAASAPDNSAKLAVAQISDRLSDPWMRATMLTPSASSFMTATRMGLVDLRPLREFMRKPTASLVMTFAADPHYGMVTDRFGGDAVVFLATATFGGMRTAALKQ